MLGKDVKCHPFETQQQLQARDCERRGQSSQWLIRQHETCANFTKQLITSDGAHLNLNGFVNKQGYCVKTDPTLFNP